MLFIISYISFNPTILLIITYISFHPTILFIIPLRSLIHVFTQHLTQVHKFPITHFHGFNQQFKNWQAAKLVLFPSRYSSRCCRALKYNGLQIGSLEYLVVPDNPSKRGLITQSSLTSPSSPVSTPHPTGALVRIKNSKLYLGYETNASKNYVNALYIHFDHGE